MILKFKARLVKVNVKSVDLLKPAENVFKISTLSLCFQYVPFNKMPRVFLTNVENAQNILMRVVLHLFSESFVKDKLCS